MRELARAGLALGFDIEEHDNWRLMIESAKWLGVPYKYGGNTKSGVDCSGLTTAIFKTVYNKNLHRCKGQNLLSVQIIVVGNIDSKGQTNRYK